VIKKLAVAVISTAGVILLGSTAQRTT